MQHIHDNHYIETLHCARCIANINPRCGPFARIGARIVTQKCPSDKQIALDEYVKAVTYFCDFVERPEIAQAMLDNPSVMRELGERAKRVIETR